MTYRCALVTPSFLVLELDDVLDVELEALELARRLSRSLEVRAPWSIGVVEDFAGSRSIRVLDESGEVSRVVPLT